MHILVLGGTGPSGLAFTTYALSQGHTCTLYVRSPKKLPPEISSHDNVVVIVGELNDVASLEKAVSSGADVLVSCLGPPNISIPTATKNIRNTVTFQNRDAETPVANGYKLLWPLLERYNFKRALILSTASYSVPEDKFSLFWTTGVGFVRTVASPAYKEIVAISEFVASQDSSKVGWTLFRVPALTGGGKSVSKGSVHVKAGFVGSKEDGWSLKREELAVWLLEEVESGKWIGKAPIISNAW